MFISMRRNAVMFRVNIQNVLHRLQPRLSVACAIHWSRCQSLPGTDGPIPPRHAGAALPRPWSGGACTHALVGSPTPLRQRRSDPDCSAAKDGGIRTASRAQPTASRTTLYAAGSINLTQYSLNSTQRPVFIRKHSQYFCCSAELLLS